MAYNRLVSPVVKWVGGKRQLLPIIREHMPRNFNRHYEPFLGGGAVLFDRQPQRAVVNDINGELINLYQVTKDNVNDLIEDLRKHQNTDEYFYTIRALDRNSEAYSDLSNVEKASRMHYLNKTCFNGLFRVNQAGQFNSPFGKYKNPNIVNEITLKAVSHYFNDADIVFRNTDFRTSLRGIRAGSFVYFDPPYDPVSDSSNFTGYAIGGFDRNEQVRLKHVCDRLNARGINFMLSNSSTKFIRKLYEDYNVFTVPAKRSINSDATKRGEIDEVLIKNYE